jgi:hypothetical protein
MTEENEFIELECRRFASCKTIIQISVSEYERRKQKYGLDYKPWCGPCTDAEDRKYRTYHSD